ncbi:hypothetical protein GQ44DRAFT_568416, partial [Phaeosphaeriaceae sp. PMI808]
PPKSGKAASILSFDSGYGTSTIDDEEPFPVRTRTFDPVTSAIHRFPLPSVTTEQVFTQFLPEPIGLGISGFNVHVEEKLHLKRSDSPINPITTKLNAFPSKAQVASQSSHPTIVNCAIACLTCQLWDITNPGEGLKCSDCKGKDYIKSDVRQLFDTKPAVKVAAPRLVIPQDPNPEPYLRRRTWTRCSACDIAHATESRVPSVCPACTSNPELLSPLSPAQTSTVKRSCARRPTKLPPHALNHLRAWLKANQDNPYPSADTKRMLAQECEITEKQVTTWFTNTRARKLAMPSDRTHSSSEDDVADESDYSSLTNTPVFTTSPTFEYTTPMNNQFMPLPQVITSNEPTQMAAQASRRGKKKDYRRLNTVSPIDESPTPRTPVTPSPNRDGHEQETWQCTFCSQHLVPKSWRRHEETQHRPKYQWTCLATSPVLTHSTHTGISSICAFCQLKNPSHDHMMKSHRISECAKKSEAERTFGRPDHLRQHMKNFHRTSLLEMVRDKWRKDGPGKNVNEGWTCGFCAQELKTWDIRETHIANHFKDGFTMASWIDYPQPTPTIMEPNRKRDHTSKGK